MFKNLFKSLSGRARRGTTPSTHDVNDTLPCEEHTSKTVPQQQAPSSNVSNNKKNNTITAQTIDMYDINITQESQQLSTKNDTTDNVNIDSNAHLQVQDELISSVPATSVTTTNDNDTIDDSGVENVTMSMQQSSPFKAKDSSARGGTVIHSPLKSPSPKPPSKRNKSTSRTSIPTDNNINNDESANLPPQISRATTDGTVFNVDQIAVTTEQIQDPLSIKREPRPSSPHYDNYYNWEFRHGGGGGGGSRNRDAGSGGGSHSRAAQSSSSSSAIGIGTSSHSTQQRASAYNTNTSTSRNTSSTTSTTSAVNAVNITATSTSNTNTQAQTANNSTTYEHHQAVDPSRYPTAYPNMFAQSQNNNDSHATTMHSTSSTYAASGQSITTDTVNATTNVTFPLFGFSADVELVSDDVINDSLQYEFADPDSDEFEAYVCCSLSYCHKCVLKYVQAFIDECCNCQCNIFL